tara:strand:- start:1538 stop:2407 length:870 start_codon:yes stop_codon:yes gene_type:complete
MNNRIRWFGPNDAANYFGGKASVEYYNKECMARREKYNHKNENKYSNVIEDLNVKGYSVLKQVFDKDKLLKLRQEAEHCISTGENVKRRDDYHAVVDDPFLNCPTAVDIAFDDLLVDIATEYFDCTPGIGTFNLRESYPNDLPETGTLLFHCDKNSPVKFIKFFFYLRDVKIDGGPFTYVEGSPNQKFNGWLNKYRWNLDEMEAIYGPNRVKYLTAEVGDVIVARTTGFHRGTKVEKDPRLMYTVNWLVHPELAGGQPQSIEKRFKMKQEDYNNLPDSKKPLTDFLVKV